MLDWLHQIISHCKSENANAAIPCSIVFSLSQNSEFLIVCMIPTPPMVYCLSAHILSNKVVSIISIVVVNPPKFNNISFCTWRENKLSFININCLNLMTLFTVSKLKISIYFIFIFFFRFDIHYFCNLIFFLNSIQVVFSMYYFKSIVPHSYRTRLISESLLNSEIFKVKHTQKCV